MTVQPAVTPYPAAGDYYKAVQAPARSFTVPKLQAAEFVWDTLGPTLARGSSAVVFQASVEGRPQALRCYVRNDASSRDRYSALDAYLAGHDLSPYVSGTTWLDAAIQVNRATWPVLTMDWIDGRTLNEYVDFLVANSNTAALTTLSAKWRELVALLQSSEFAHGDLQHGNVMVDQEGRIRLVDFDGVWIPQLAGLSPPTEFGHPNYQHPAIHVWDRWLDTFSALVIYLSLVALGKEPGLWLALYNSKNLLFAKNDFFPPFKTDAWKQLASLGDPEVDELVRRLQECCDLNWVSDKSLEMTLDQQPVTAAWQRIPVEQRWWERKPSATGGYPAAGYPAAGYPAAGYPAAGYPAAGYPAAGYPAAGGYAAGGSAAGDAAFGGSATGDSPADGSAESAVAAGSPSRPWPGEAPPAQPAGPAASPAAPASAEAASGTGPAAAATAAAQGETARIAARSLPAPPPLSAPLGRAGTGPTPELSRTMAPPGETVWWAVPPARTGQTPSRPESRGSAPPGPVPYGPVPPAPQGYAPPGPAPSAPGSLPAGPPAPGSTPAGAAAPTPPARAAKRRPGPLIGAAVFGLGVVLLIIGAARDVPVIVVGGLIAVAWGMWRLVTGIGRNTKPPGQT
jgi:hypothetical protein